MLRFLLRRVLLGIPVLVAVATLTFLIMHWVPGGPFDTEKILPPAIIANIEAKYHLDQPLGIQYLLYMKQSKTYHLFLNLNLKILLIRSNL